MVGERLLEDRHEAVEGRLDGQRPVVHPQCLGLLLRVFDADVGGIAERHHHRLHPVRAESVHRHRQGQGGIDAPGQAQQRALEAVLVDVVTGCQHQGPVQAFLVFRHRQHFTAHFQRAAFAAQVHRDQRFLEAGALHTDTGFAVHHERGAVENQLVLTAHQIAVEHRQTGFPGAGADLVAALTGLAGAERRRIQVDDAGGAVAGGLGRRPLEPDVLANGDGQALPAQLEHTALISGLEVTLFIENPVIGQALLEILMPGAAVPREQDAGGIAAHAITHRRIAQHHRYLDTFADVRQRVVDAAVQAGAQQQVFRRVAGEHQFGEHHQLGAQQIARLTSGGHHRIRVALDIPDQRVALGHHYSHITSLFSMER